MQNMEESFSRFDDKTTHRYFVITHVDPNDDVLIVNRSTYHGFPSEDTSCILTKERLERDVSTELYERMRAGARMSDFIPHECYLFIMNH